MAPAGGRSALAPDELRARRRALGVSQEALGRLLGVTGNTVARWERGQQRLANPVLLRLALERLELGHGAHQPLHAMAPPTEQRNQHNLPAPLTSFIGRRQDLRTLRRLLATARLVTVTGAPGIGKTRLALETARGVVGQHADGVWLVELAPLEQRALVARTLAAALTVPERSGRPLAESLTAWLASRRLLLVLDNCEHLLPNLGNLVSTLLGGCPGLRVLATSREVLGLPGEVAWRVSPLSVPRPEQAAGLEGVLRSEAAALFLERGRAAEPGFTLTPANVAAVAEICCRLDGLPLALELAAARTHTLGAVQIAARLEDRFHLLADRTDTASTPAHHHTLQTAIGWSYALLSDVERRVFERLAVFAGGWTLEAAEAVCTAGGVSPQEVLGALERLADRSLVVVERSVHGVVRYRLLETLRAYAAQMLSAADRARAERRHAEFYCELAERVGARLVRPEQAVWLARLEDEVANMRAALIWCLAHPAAGLPTGLRLLCALTHFWQLGAHLQEGRDWLEQLLSAAPADVPGRANGLWTAGFLAWHAGDLAVAGATWQAGLRQAHERGEAEALPRLLIGVGTMLAVQGQVAVGDQMVQDGHDRAREQGDLWAAGLAQFWLGQTARARGDYARARVLFEASEALLRDLGDRRHLAYVALSLGQVAQATGEFEAALGHYREALHMAQGLADALGTIWALEGISSALAATGGARLSARLLGAVETQRAGVSTATEPVPGWAEASARTRSSLRRQLGERAFAASLAAGRRLPREIAMAEALGIAEVEDRRQARALSRREREVAHLLAAGLTNRQIAERLILAEGTAQRHVANILQKLGFTSRAQVAVWAVAHL